MSSLEARKIVNEAGIIYGDLNDHIVACPISPNIINDTYFQDQIQASPLDLTGFF